MGKLTIRASG